MSAELLLAMASALWIGVLTAISPCPLATNIAAISFIGRKLSDPRRAVLTGVLYGVGRSLVYVALAVVLVSSVLSVAEASQIQRWMNRLLGPVLVLVGMFLLGLVRLPAIGGGVGERVGKRVEGWGVWAGLALGVVFALSFCPASAALYFLSFLPLAVKYESSVLLPALYGAGTALPVFVFAVVLVASGNALGRSFDRVTGFERWARRVTGGLFLAVGVYFSLVYAWRVL